MSPKLAILFLLIGVILVFRTSTTKLRPNQRISAMGNECAIDVYPPLPSRQRSLRRQASSISQPTQPRQSSG